MKSTVTQPHVGGNKYIIQVRHEGLHKFREVKGDNAYVVRQKAQSLANQWDEMWAKKASQESRRDNLKSKQQQAEQRTIEAQKALDDLTKILAYTLTVNDAIDWESLKNNAAYSVPVPIRAPLAPMPQRTAPQYQVKVGFFEGLLGGRAAKEAEAKQRFEQDMAMWEKSKNKVEADYILETLAWEKAQTLYLEERNNTNAAVEAQKQDYLRGQDSQAIIDYCELVLSRSLYPDSFPHSFEMEYNSNTKVLVLDYKLPALEDVPTLREVKYTQSKDEFSEKHITDTQRNKVYDDLLYQIALRTLHELFEADKINAIDTIGFNGYVYALNPATGKSQDVCVLSLQVAKAEFEQINLAKIDLKACFKSLKGVGSSKLYSYAPIAPVLKMDKEDKRFVSSYDVTPMLQEGDNLASMPWEDFEHLIREIFEKEFSVNGGEVRVTQASRDGGVDAVVFDPDPLRGGKYVVQAKRYNNTVGVSAVRDLYGTLMNEGANKGILVTTSDYGPDAYEFARGKPITLLNGSNLLHMLEKHGHKARIDLKEAKKFM